MTKIEILERLLAFDIADRKRPPDDLWWHVATGEISVTEAVERRREHEGEDEEELRRKAEMFAPPSEQEREDALDDLLSGYYPVAAQQQAPRLHVAMWGGMLAAAAAAAVVALWVFIPPDPGPPSELAKLPKYAISFSNQWTGDMLAAESGDDGSEGCASYHPDLDLKVLLRPSTSFGDDVSVLLRATPSSGEELWPDAHARLGSKGVVTIERRISELGLTPGRWLLTFFVVRPGQAPEGYAELASGVHPGVTVMQEQVCIVGKDEVGSER